MHLKKQIRNLTIVTLIILLGSFILLRGEGIFLKNGTEMLFSPGMTYVLGSKENHTEDFFLIEMLIPFYQYANEHAPITAEVEDVLTYEMILAEQANDEYSMSEDLQPETSTPAETASKDTVKTSISLEKLKDFNYLLSKFKFTGVNLNHSLCF